MELRKSINHPKHWARYGAMHNVMTLETRSSIDVPLEDISYVNATLWHSEQIYQV